MTRKVQLEDIQIMTLDVYIVLLDDKKDQKRNKEPVLGVQIRLVPNTVRSEVIEIKTGTIKEVDCKCEHIIN